MISILAALLMTLVLVFKMRPISLPSGTTSIHPHATTATRLHSPADRPNYRFIYHFLLALILNFGEMACFNQLQRYLPYQKGRASMFLS